MSSFVIEGGHRLSGNITPQGAKNEALQIIAATLLTSEKVVIENIPDILDVNRLIDLLVAIGVKVDRFSRESCAFQADDIHLDYLQSDDFMTKMEALRGSILIVGPLLARFKRIGFPQPGGDKIGRRRLDTHFTGFENLGAKVSYDRDKNRFTIEAKRLKGANMLLEEASVTGTANIIMAAVFAEGVTTLFNAACEPYICQLCTLLNRMGANISGVGSNLLTIEGVERLHGTTHRLLPDMIEIGSFIGMAVMTKSDITIKNVAYEQLGLIPATFRSLGIQLDRQGEDLHIPSHDHYEIANYMDGSMLTIADAPWPGFTPDLISIVLVTAIQARGSVLIHQKMFESRLFFVDKLIDMGAKIILCDPHRASVIGLDNAFPLRGVRMISPDIRAGVALLIAALSANGISTIDNIDQIDRGYQHIDQRLNALGAHIQRVS
ncbi:UDP-N-acetylglucosamine 1-carboxyvinyltransferase [Bacteroidia bacterium]|nr:UDP-N-acetylglucosamine 1-carboxyvinyltransferase [Bacteroidia bacterium]